MGQLGVFVFKTPWFQDTRVCVAHFDMFRDSHHQIVSFQSCIKKKTHSKIVARFNLAVWDRKKALTYLPVTILSGIDGSVQTTKGHIQRGKSAYKHTSFVNMAAMFFLSCDNSEAIT